MGDKIEIVEVGPRDGLQSQSELIHTDVKLQLINRLIDAGVKRIEVASFVNPARVPQMADIDELIPKLKKSESSTVQGIISESDDNIVNVISRTSKIYSNFLNGLSTQNSDLLKKSKKGVAKLDSEIEELRDNIFFLIKKIFIF